MTTTSDWFKPPRGVKDKLSRGGLKEWRLRHTVAAGMPPHLLFYFAMLCNCLHDYQVLIKRMDEIENVDDKFIRDNKNGTAAAAPHRAEMLKTVGVIQKLAKTCGITAAEAIEVAPEARAEEWE